MLTKSKTNCTVLVVLCETNVLSLISQRLDNYYQIQTKRYSALQEPESLAAPILLVTKHGPKHIPLADLEKAAPPGETCLHA